MANKFIQLKANRIVDAESTQDGSGASRLVITTKSRGITIVPGAAASGGIGATSDGGASVSISGARNTAGVGGGVAITGGQGATGSLSGGITLTAASTSRAGTGANITIAAGDQTNASGTPGDLILKGGTGIGAATGLGGNTLLQIGGLSNSTGKIKATYRSGGLTELEALVVDNYGNVTLHGDTGVNLGSTSPFLYMKGSSGRPTGSPTVAPANGVSALRYDITNKKLYITQSTNEWKPLAIVPQEYDAGNSGTAKTIDWDNADAQKLTLTGNVTLTLSNPFTGSAYILKILGGAGTYTTTWPGTVIWSDESGPAAPDTTAAGKVVLVNLYWDGTNYRGTYATYAS